DGIRDFHVTGVQTCALPICAERAAAVTIAGRLDARVAAVVPATEAPHPAVLASRAGAPDSAADLPPIGALADAGRLGHRAAGDEIGRASCRARVGIAMGAVA